MLEHDYGRHGGNSLKLLSALENVTSSGFDGSISPHADRGELGVIQYTCMSSCGIDRNTFF